MTRAAVKNVDPEPTDIGHGVSIRPVRVEGRISGFEFWHPCKPGDNGASWLQVHPDLHPCWKIQSESPLTLSPSVLCRTCGHHGFIRDGKWVPA